MYPQYATPVPYFSPLPPTARPPAAYTNTYVVPETSGQERPEGAASETPPIAGVFYPELNSSSGVLNRPLEPTSPVQAPSIVVPTAAEMVITKIPDDPPLGFAGRTTVVPRSGNNDDYETVEDRWRIGFPYWSRYAVPGTPEFPLATDYPFKLGHIWDPYNQNILKGDYPILGQHTFFSLTLQNTTLVEGQTLPTATTPFESTARRRQLEFFGRPNRLLVNNLSLVTLDFFHGDTASFKPNDWRVKATAGTNFSYLDVEELGVISPDVRKGTTRARGINTLQEWFVEYKLADLSPEYDFVSIRAGSQPFNSDFRSFIFADTDKGVRLFGNYNANRTQYNLLFFRKSEKDTNSGLDTFNDRGQDVLIANLYQFDFVYPGYTAQWSVHYNNDDPSIHFDKNRFLVRPDPVGVVRPHRVETVYLGWTGDGHIDRYNVNHAFYYVTGRDSQNPLATTAQNVNAFMGAFELSYDRDWARFRASGFYSSGDGNPNNGHATGFDTILDTPNFAGGDFSFWQRQQINVFGAGVVQRNSLVPNLRSSKLQGQANHVNPGLWIANFGFDADITPKLRSINNINYLWFDKTASLETFLFEGKLDREIGVDLSTGIEYRPFLSNNVLILAGASTLLPSSGFKNLFNRIAGHANPLAAAFVEVTFLY